MPRRLPFLAALLLALACLIAGCRTTRTRTVEVTVANEAEEPVMLWLTKRDRPFGPQWLSPEQWLTLQEQEIIGADAPSPAVELPPRTKVTLGPQSGKFRGRGDMALLLVYSMPVTLEEMAATPRGSSLRDVITLRPGRNFVRVRSTSPVRAEWVTDLNAPRRPLESASPPPPTRPEAGQ